VLGSEAGRRRQTPPQGGTVAPHGRRSTGTRHADHTACRGAWPTPAAHLTVPGLAAAPTARAAVLPGQQGPRPAPGSAGRVDVLPRARTRPSFHTVSKHGSRRRCVAQPARPLHAEMVRHHSVCGGVASQTQALRARGQVPRGRREPAGRRYGRMHGGDSRRAGARAPAAADAACAVPCGRAPAGACGRLQAVHDLVCVPHAPPVPAPASGRA